MATIYRVSNGHSATTGPTAKVATPVSGATQTMMQLVPGSVGLVVTAFEISFDGSAAATPLVVELCQTTTVPATALTAYVANDVTCANGVVDPGITAAGLTLGTGASGFATGSAPTEGSAVAPVRSGRLALVAPSNEYIYQWPLGQGFYVPVSGVLRVRVTNSNAGAFNCLCSVEFGLGGD